MATTLVGAEGNQQTPPPEGQPQTGQAPPPEDDDAATGLTVEEVDQRWRHRVSQKDKAHAAAEQALRDENERLRRQLAGPPPQSGGQSGTGGSNGGDADYYRQQYEQSQQEVERERQLRAIESKRAKYPALAAQVGDSGVAIFGTADDATLARLNALADDEAQGASTFAPTTPRKPAPAKPKSITDMSKEELEAELKRSVERGGHLAQR